MQKNNSAMRPSVWGLVKHSRNGALAKACFSRKWMNTGDSNMLIRLLIEISNNTMDNRNGTRHPQTWKSSTLNNDCNNTICNVDTRMPNGPINCSTLV